jgi:hypothetical protein
LFAEHWLDGGSSKMPIDIKSSLELAVSFLILTMNLTGRIAHGLGSLLDPTAAPYGLGSLRIHDQ